MVADRFQTRLWFDNSTKIQRNELKKSGTVKTSKAGGDKRIKGSCGSGIVL